ncbi:hypothetical protein I3760_05G229000 [Carya illinoinensis]|nr:hypothetical protein I3760_05G229000 [Carya illinoinensis]
MLSSEVADSYVIGDYIGVESCLDLKDHDNKELVSGALMEISTIARGDELMENIVHESRDDYDDEGNYYSKYCRGKREQRLVAWKKKEFPPPIPSLARTGNLPSHMPWVLKRHYTSDGRLVLTEEKVRHHEYFRAHRANGRLTLQLVPLDNYNDAWLSRSPSADHDEHDDYGANEEPLMMSDSDQDHQEKDHHVHHDNEDEDHIVDGGDHLLLSGDDDEVEKEIVEKDWGSSVVEDSASMNGSSGILGVNGAGKCLNYNNTCTSGSSCIFGVPVIGEINTVRS